MKTIKIIATYIGGGDDFDIEMHRHLEIKVGDYAAKEEIKKAAIHEILKCNWLRYHGIDNVFLVEDSFTADDVREIDREWESMNEKERAGHERAEYERLKKKYEAPGEGNNT